MDEKLVVRAERIRQLVCGKRVMDIGCCAHGVIKQKRSGELFLHGQIAESAREVIGVDNDAEAIRIVNEAGYNVVFGDAMELSALGLEKFDVIFAGELVEHLSSPGKFLDEAAKCLNDDGLLIITVPNAFSYKRIKQLKKGIDDALWTHAQHTCWYSRATTRFLLERHGYRLIELAYCDLFRSNRRMKHLLDSLRMGWAMGPRFAESIFAVARKP